MDDLPFSLVELGTEQIGELLWGKYYAVMQAGQGTGFEWVHDGIGVGLK